MVYVYRRPYFPEPRLSPRRWIPTAPFVAPDEPVVQAFSCVDNGNATSVTCTEPSGTINGDLLVAIIATDGSRTITANTGGDWTDITGNQDEGTVSSRAFYHRRGVSAPDLVFNLGGTERALGCMFRIDGHIASGDPIDNQASGTGDSVSPISPDLTTNVIDTLVIRAFAGDRDRITADTGFPASMANDHHVTETTGGANACSSGAADEAQAIADSVGTATWTNVFSDGEGWIAMTIVIKPPLVSVVRIVDFHEIGRGTTRGIARAIG